MGPRPAAPEAIARLFPDLDQIERYIDLLLNEGVDFGLIGPRETARIWDRHILNSVALSALVEEGAAVVDVGSGAGLPGLPLACARPDLALTLLEPMLRRSTFLREAVAVLGVSERVQVARGRAEDHTERYDVVVARAVAPLPRLLGWCAPLLRAGGTMLCLKGRSADQEVADAAVDLRARRLEAEVLQVQPIAETEPATVVRIRPRDR